MAHIVATAAGALTNGHSPPTMGHRPFPFLDVHASNLFCHHCLAFFGILPHPIFLLLPYLFLWRITVFGFFGVTTFLFWAEPHSLLLMMLVSPLHLMLPRIRFGC
jgi:hypothetical protein